MFVFVRYTTAKLLDILIDKNIIYFVEVGKERFSPSNFFLPKILPRKIPCLNFPSLFNNPLTQRFSVTVANMLLLPDGTKLLHERKQLVQNQIEGESGIDKYFLIH